LLLSHLCEAIASRINSRPIGTGRTFSMTCTILLPAGRHQL
jgi:hypothetical protein